MTGLRQLSQFRYLVVAVTLTLLCLLLALAPGRAHAACDGMIINSDGDWEFDYRICEPHPGRLANSFSGTWYGAIAKSDQSGKFGGSQRSPSRAAAEKGALAACARNGGRACKVVIWGANNCMALAEYPNGAWAAEPSNYDRSDATTKAANSCRKYAGGRCEVVVSVCGRSAANGPQCTPFHPNDISRGEAWKEMSEEERRMWNRRPNGACK